MSLPITIDQMRTEISDLPKWNGPTSVPPEMIGTGDGTRMVFPLKFRRAVLGSVQVYLGVIPSAPTSQPLVYDQIAYNDGTNPWSAVLDSNSLPNISFVSAPAAGRVVGARYLVSRFTDAEIQGYLDGNDVLDTEMRALTALHAAMIPADLSDPERMVVRKIGDTSFDSSQYQRTMLTLRTSLLASLDKPPAATAPSFHIGRIGGGRRW